MDFSGSVLDSTTSRQNVSIPITISNQNSCELWYDTKMCASSAVQFIHIVDAHIHLQVDHKTKHSQQFLMVTINQFGL